MADDYRGAVPTISDTPTGAPPLQARRKFDRTDEIIFRERSAAPLFSILNMNLQKRPTGDPKFNHWEDAEMKRSFQIAGESGGAAAALAATDTSLYIENADRYLKVDEVLHIPQGQANQTNASARALGENVVITAISGSVVTVTRNATGANNVTSAGGAPYLGAGLLGASYREGGSTPDAINTVIGEGWNYTEICKEAIAITGTMLSTDLYGPSELQRKLKLARNKVTREIEAKFLLGERSMVFENKKPKRKTGGVMQWLFNPSMLGDPDGDLNDYLNNTSSSGYDLVTGDHSARVHYLGGSLTWPAFLRYCEWAFAYGNKNKWALAGPTFLTEFNILFKDQVRLNPTYSGKYGLTITDVVTQHGTLHMVQEPEFFAVAQQLGTTPMGYSNSLVVLDLPFMEYRYAVAKEGGPGFKFGGSRDLTLREGIQNPRDDELQDVFHAEVGIGLKFAKAHSVLIGVDSVA